MSHKYKISVKNFDWECGDGCCIEQGREWYVDGELVYRGACEDNGWMTVLEKLGIDAELEGLDEEGEVIWSL